MLKKTSLKERTRGTQLKYAVANADTTTYTEVRDGYYKACDGLLGLIDGLKQMQEQDANLKQTLESVQAALELVEGTGLGEAV